MAATTATSEALVPLRDGLVVSATSLRVLWQLEERGFNLVALADGRLRVTPPNRLTPEERGSIRQYRDELVALVRICEAIQ